MPLVSIPRRIASKNLRTLKPHNAKLKHRFQKPENFKATQLFGSEVSTSSKRSVKSTLILKPHNAKLKHRFQKPENFKATQCEAKASLPKT
jgi:hypothetical protein